MAITISRPSGGISRCGAIILAIDADTKTYQTPAIFLAYTKQNKAVTSLEIRVSVRTNNITKSIDVSAQAIGSTNNYEIPFSALTDTNFPASAVIGTDYTSATLDATGVNVAGAGAGKIKIVVVRNKSTTSNIDLTFVIDGQSFVEPIPPSKGAVFILDNTPSTSSITLKDANNTGNLSYFELTVSDTAKNSDNITITLTEKDAFNNIVDTGTLTEAFYWLNIAYATRGSSSFLGYKVTE